VKKLIYSQEDLDLILSLETETKDKEIERLTFESTKWESKFYDEAKKVDKAIEKIESIRIYGLRSGKTLFATLLNEILDILKGSE
jgi:hypothetical protein